MYLVLVVPLVGGNMNIGVFGDSFASKTCVDIWWKYLEEYGHTVTCFGESGSSILFSAKLILQEADNYDVCVWTVTNPPRFTFKDSQGKNFHYTRTEQTTDIELSEKIKSADMYFKNLFDWDEADLTGTALCHYMMSKFNLLIVPCFYSPLKKEFNLYELCEREARYFFPNKDIVEIYQEYTDIRDGHLCPNNQKILAKLISENLNSGVFQTDYENFEKPRVSVNEAFKK